MIKGDTLVEKLFYLAKRGLFTNYQERDLVKKAAMQLQTLQAEKALAAEGVRPGQTEVSEFGERGCLYTCGACNAPLDRGDAYCRRCGKRVQWTEVL